MRSDTQSTISQLHRSDQKDLTRGVFADRLQAIESRLHPQTQILAAIAGQITRDRDANSGDPGVVVLSDFGLHFEGRFEQLDLGWDEIRSCRVASSWDTAAAAARTMPLLGRFASSWQEQSLFVVLSDDTVVKFVLSANKHDSISSFSAVVAQISGGRRY